MKEAGCFVGVWGWESARVGAGSRSKNCLVATGCNFSHARLYQQERALFIRSDKYLSEDALGERDNICPSSLCEHAQRVSVHRNEKSAHRQNRIRGLLSPRLRSSWDRDAAISNATPCNNGLTLGLSCAPTPLSMAAPSVVRPPDAPGAQPGVVVQSPTSPSFAGGSAMSPGALSPTSPGSTVTAATAPTRPPGSQPQRSVWERLRYSHGIWGYIYRFGAPPPSTRTTREVFVNDHAANEKERYVDNRVVTSRYTWWNFVPLFLFQQFTRFANAYFLCVSPSRRETPVQPARRHQLRCRSWFRSPRCCL